MKMQITSPRAHYVSDRSNLILKFNKIYIPNTIVLGCNVMDFTPVVGALCVMNTESSSSIYSHIYKFGTL